jgi:uncharacterized protein (DUF1697 family)
VTRYVALLRAVNLAGKNAVAMAELRAWVEDLGFQNPRTLLQSGNVVFEGREQATDRIEARLEAGARQRLGVETSFFVRTGDQIAELVARNPFKKKAADPGHLLVVFMKTELNARAVRALQDAVVGREVVRGAGRQLYAVYPDGVGRSKLTAALIERKLGGAGTGRNWNTVQKLKELACG